MSTKPTIEIIEDYLTYAWGAIDRAYDNLDTFSSGADADHFSTLMSFIEQDLRNAMALVKHAKEETRGYLQRLNLNTIVNFLVHADGTWSLAEMQSAVKHSSLFPARPANLLT